MPPTLAMSSFSSVTTKQYQHDHDHQGDWDHRESSGPVYCSCNVM